MRRGSATLVINNRSSFLSTAGVTCTKTLPFTIKPPCLWETLAQTSFFLLSLSSHLEMLRVSVSRSHEAAPETSLNKKGEPGLLCNHTALKAGVLTQPNNEWRDVGFEGASKGIEWGQKWSHASELSLSWSPWDLKKKALQSGLAGII